MNEKKTKTSKGIYFLIGALTGFIIYFSIYGWERISFTNDSWIYNLDSDLTQHYLGWQFYRNGSWQFPIGLTDQMTYPNSISVIFTDSIPILAIFFKLFRNILPETFQYFGFYGLLCFLLQGGMSSLITSRFHSSKVTCVLSSILFVFSPVMLFRMYQHTALASHYLLLIAIYLWFCCPKIHWKKALLCWCGLGFLCAGIHMYFIPMTGIILIAFCLRQLISRHETMFQCLIQIIAFCTSAFLMIWLEGGFFGKSDTAATGLGLYNANLNTLFNGMDKSFFLPCIPYLPGQNEGYGYLGFGIILLLITSIIIYIISKIHIKEKYSQNPDLKAIIISTIWLIMIPLTLAVCTRISFNQRELFTFQLPGILNSLLSIFRCSGRFIWIIDYIIIVYAIKLTISKKNPKVFIPILTLCCILQPIDMKYYYTNSTIPVKEPLYQSEAWDELAEHYNKINIIGELDEATYLEFGWYIAKNHFSTSQFHIARLNSEDIQKSIDASLIELQEGNPSDDTIYIFNHALFYDEYNLNLYELDGLYIGIKGELENVKKLDATTMEYELNNSLYVINGEDTEQGRVLHQDGISHGPYIYLPEYEYQITVEGDNLSVLDYDVYSGTYARSLTLDYIITNDNELQYTFQINEDYADWEIRFFNDSNTDAVIRHIYITTCTD